MTTGFDVAGAAALAVCESLLLSLGEQGILEDTEIAALLRDAAAGHRAAVASGADDPQRHEAAAALIDRIVAGGNSVRHL